MKSNIMTQTGVLSRTIELLVATMIVEPGTTFIATRQRLVRGNSLGGNNQ